MPPVSLQKEYPYKRGRGGLTTVIIKKYIVFGVHESL
jgi:hypothetical protein